MASLSFSANIIVGALVLPLVTKGIIDASTTRSPDTPCTLPCGSTTASRSVAGPMRAVHDKCHCELIWLVNFASSSASD